MSAAASQGGQGNLSEWVSRIQQQHSGAGAAAGTHAAARSSVMDAGSSADALEDEVKRAREERMKRRGQISPNKDPAALVTPDALTGEDILKKALADRGLSSTSPSFDSNTGFEQGKAQSMRSNALLDRYGGASGPTGVARAGTHESPVSLASFMGGKASGPRLGKLAGDGRSAPPEASTIHETRNALPGLARPSATSSDNASNTPLASFLEARASGRASPTRLGFSPPKRSYSPPKLQDKPINIQTNLQVQRQYGSHVERKDAATSPFKSPDLRPSGLTSTSKTGTMALSPGAIVHSPTADALARFPDLSSDPTARNPLPSPKLAQEEQSASPAFLATEQSTDRLPTASLTRLRSQKMVEQRIREAQEWGGSQDQSLPPPGRSPQIVGSGGVKDLWKSGESQSSPQSQTLRSPISPTHGLSNALPGLSSQPGFRSGAPKNLYAVNRKTPEEEAAAFAAPVRLPGMGGAISPFASRKNTEEEEDKAVGTLEPLARGRAKPKRTVPPSSSANSLRREQEDAKGDRILGETPTLRLATSEDYQGTQNRQLSSDTTLDSATNIKDNAAALQALVDGRAISAPPAQMSAIPSESLKRRTGTLKIARNRDQSIQLDLGILSDSRTQFRDALTPQTKKTISLELFLVHPDGTTTNLQGDDDDAAATLYETETQVIVHRFKETATSAVICTKVYARVGRLSSIVLGQNSAEARKAMEIAHSYRVPLVDARQGRESIELAQLLGGCLITREGTRQGEGTRSGARSMFQIREMQKTLFIDQVDVLTSCLSSAFTVVITPGENRTALVWHGKGTTRIMRQAGAQFAETLTGSSRTVSQVDEGKEGQAFWSLLDRDVQYSNAWHHQLLPTLNQDAQHVRLFGIQDGAQSSAAKRLTELTPFSALDIRRDGVYLLQLPFELYVLVGPDARSQRELITALLDAGQTLSRQLTKLRGPHIMSAPTHVVVFPSLVPREVRNAFRYWHDEHLNGKRWQRMQLRMNVWERKEALQQMQRNEYSLAELDDDLFLPVGVGLADVKDLNI